jgi:hypothetical protein
MSSILMGNDFAKRFVKLKLQIYHKICIYNLTMGHVPKECLGFQLLLRVP